MGSTTVNGVIKQVPYGLIRNFQDAARERIDVMVFDSTGQLRDFIIEKAKLDAGVPFYLDETVKVVYQRGCQGATPICDVITVDPATGAEAVASTESFTAPRQRSLVLKCTAIDAGSGVATLTTGYEVF